MTKRPEGAPRRFYRLGRYHSKLVDAVTADDRQYFEDHPGESVRYREAAAGEFTPIELGPPPTPQSTLMVEVRKSHGSRVRTPFWAELSVWPLPGDPD